MCKPVLAADVLLADFTAQSARGTVLVRTDRPADLRAALLADGVAVTEDGDGALDISGLTAREIGDRALAAGIAVHELTPVRASLEEAFMELTGDAVQYHGGSARTPDPIGRAA